MASDARSPDRLPSPPAARPVLLSPPTGRAGCWSRLLKALHRARHCFEAPADCAPLVWLDPHHAPSTDIERRIYERLADGPLPLPDLIEQLAEAEVRDCHARGEWRLDVGAAALPALRGQVWQQLIQLDGRQIALETPTPIRDAALDSWQLRLCA